MQRPDADEVNPAMPITGAPPELPPDPRQADLPDPNLDEDDEDDEGQDDENDGTEEFVEIDKDDGSTEVIERRVDFERIDGDDAEESGEAEEIERRTDNVEREGR